MNKLCPTCKGSTRETTNLICQTCGFDYGRPRITAQDIVHHVNVTGLRSDTCLDLLYSGWTLVEEVNEPPRFESPLANLKEKNE